MFGHALIGDITAGILEPWLTVGHDTQRRHVRHAEMLEPWFEPKVRSLTMGVSATGPAHVVTGGGVRGARSNGRRGVGKCAGEGEQRANGQHQRQDGERSAGQDKKARDGVHFLAAALRCFFFKFRRTLFDAF